MDAFHICKQLWLAWVVAWCAWALFTKRTQRRENPGTRLLYGSFVALGAFLVFADSRLWPSGWLRDRIFPTAEYTAWLGVALTAAGLLFSVWARLHLGSNWSGAVTVKVGHELIRSGPYRLVRHPIYSGILLAMMGTAFCHREVRGFLGVALVYVGFTFKSRLEEGFMEQTFGSAYQDYRRHTGGIIPKIL